MQESMFTFAEYGNTLGTAPSFAIKTFWTTAIAFMIGACLTASQAGQSTCTRREQTPDAIQHKVSVRRDVMQ